MDEAEITLLLSYYNDVRLEFIDEDDSEEVDEWGCYTPFILDDDDTESEVEFEFDLEEEPDDVWIDTNDLFIA
jgi:hypothetical protein